MGTMNHFDRGDFVESTGTSLLPSSTTKFSLWELSISESLSGIVMIDAFMPGDGIGSDPTALIRNTDSASKS